MSDDSVLYKLSHIVHRYGGEPVLNIDQWEVSAGACTGVFGPNGSGKSTLLGLLGFVMLPSSGAILFRGRPAVPFSQAVRGTVALLPQDSFLLKRSVYRNVAYGVKAVTGNGKVGRRVADALEMVGLAPSAYSKRPWYALSGGEARRVALAARLALHPEVLIMDEPTISVDAASAQRIKEAALHARQQWGTALIIASHDSEWLEDICTETLHLFKGRPMGSGKRSLLFGPWQLSEGQAVKQLGEGQLFRASNPPQDLETATAALEARHLSFQTEDTAGAPGRCVLEGFLQRIQFEQSSGLRCASVLIGNTSLSVYLPKEDAAVYAQPGDTVRIRFDPANVAWY